MASLDEGVLNLERFCGLLAQTSSGIGQSAAALDARGSDLDRLEGEAGEALDDLADALQDALDIVQDEGADTVDSVERLGEEARALADSRLGAAEDRLGQHGDSVSQALAADGEALERGYLDLEGGFDSLGEAVGGVQAGVESADGRNDDDFGTFTRAAEDLGERAEAEYVDTGEAFTQAAEAVGEAQAGLAEAGEECASAWADELPEQVESEMSDAVDAAEAAYEGFGGDAVSEGDTLIDELGTVAGEAASFLGVEQSGQLEEAANDACDERMGRFDVELAAARATLEGGLRTTAVLDPLVGELEISERVVAEVDALLAALG